MADILLVDDDPQLLYTMAEILSAAGHSVMPAQNGHEAIACIASGSLPDLVITDLRMPVMSGTELVLMIRNEPAWARLPVILVTAAALDSGVFPPDGSYQAVVSKPFDIAVLLATVARVLGCAGHQAI
jgi:two-component system chemotaxis response regulator CheY